MIISHKYRFIFIKTRKTAGTSTEVFLSSHCGDDDIVTPIAPHVDPHRPRHYQGFFNPFPEMAHGSKRTALKELFTRRRYYNHIPAWKLRGRVPRGIWDNYFKFCVTRNPWDRSLSHFHMLKHQFGFSFEEYLERGNLCHNLPGYQDPNCAGKLLVDRLLRYEDLMDELADVFGILGIPFEGSLNVNAKADYRQNRRPYQEVYSDEQRDIVTRAFAEEIALTHYEF